MSVFGQEKSPGLFEGRSTGAGHPGAPEQEAQSRDKEQGAQAAEKAATQRTGEELLRDAPISMRQKSFGEILSSLQKQLEEDIREFKRKAYEAFSYDEKIIKARNNYARILEMVRVETRKLNDLEENVDFFLQYVRDMDKTTGESAMDVVREVEKLSDEFNAMLRQVRDRDDDVMELVNENMGLIRAIDEKLGEAE